jgi:hypothetical protein
VEGGVCVRVVVMVRGVGLIDGWMVLEMSRRADVELHEEDDSPRARSTCSVSPLT